MTPKVVFVDWGVFVFRAIFAWRVSPNKAIPAPYTALRMLLACLRCVGLQRDDLVVIAADGRRSWRKDEDTAYKANRKQQRESYADINWDEQFAAFDELLGNLQAATPFNVIRIDRLEADDVISAGVRYFPDRPCVVISSDADYEQLVAFPNVRVFSDRTKRYKHVPNPYKVLAEKIRKETSDNLTAAVVSEADYQRRELIVSLLTLPAWVDEQVHAALATVRADKDYQPSLLRFRSLRIAFEDVLDSPATVTYEECMRKLTKSKTRKKPRRSKDAKDCEVQS